MLTRADTAFCSGRARYRDHPLLLPERTPKIYVRFRLPVEPVQTMEAQLDTGAAWSIVDSSVARAAGLLSRSGPPVEVHTRLGSIRGHLERITITLLADEGSSLHVDATIFVSPTWHMGHFLGYGGLLERIRFAVDPGDNSFYFGPVD